jgi:tungstate transport system substrate-binding protein
VALVGTDCRVAAPPPLTLATTTSVGNSGLLEPLSRAWRNERGAELRSHLAGSGLALGMLAKGEADVAISHAPALESAALPEHPRWRYRKIMFNDFVLVGPTEDPAHVRSAAGIEAAMQRIAGAPVRFLSRGDQSGTHERENALWTLAGIRPAADRLVIAGAGMGATLRIASETGAYTLTDRATFAQLESTLRLVIVCEGGEALLNTYAVIVDPEGPLADEANAFADWLSEGNGREVIERYTVGAAVQAFNVWPRGRKRDQPRDLP